MVNLKILTQISKKLKLLNGKSLALKAVKFSQETTHKPELFTSKENKGKNFTVNVNLKCSLVNENISFLITELYSIAFLLLVLHDFKLKTP